MLQVREVVEPVLALLASYVWDDAAGEVESKALVAHGNLRTVWILHGIHRCECLAQGSNLGSWVVEAMADGFQLAFCHERLIALHIDDDIPIAANFLDSFLNAVGTALVVGAGHHRLTAKSLHGIEDALVVGSHVGFLQDGCYFLINVLDYWFATKHGEWLTWETR